jgi:hypothetical protein
MKGPNGGMLWVDRVRDGGSCAILTQNFPEEERPKYKNGRNRGWGAFYGRDLSINKVELSGNDAMNRKGGEVGFMALRGLLSVWAEAS